VPAATIQYDAQHAIETFRQAARLNLEELNREGAIIRLPGYGQAVMTGDMHGHKKNLEKLQKYAMLDRVSARHVILHEMVHAEKHGDEIDHSHEVLLLAAEYKVQFPEQVHFLQSNHELAQLTGYQIAKNGRLVIQDYNDAVLLAYGKTRGAEVLTAMNEFIASFPLAIVTQNRIWMSHSLPNAAEMDEFDLEVFKRPPTLEDLKDNKTIFNLVWGRRQSKEQLDKLAEVLGVDIFLVGHQPQEMGYDYMYDRLIILASDHNHGTFLPFDLSKLQTADDLIRNIRKFVAVA
jgi:calcineurin-like phosphoesterase family protein